MRFASLSVLLLSFTLSLAARADFSGHWSGSGDVSGDFDISCDDVTVDVTQTDTQFVLTNGVANCGFISESLGTQTYQIKGDQLWQNNQQVGTIDATHASAKLTGASYTGDVSITLTSSDTVDVVADIDKGGSTYHVTGSLEKGK